MSVNKTTLPLDANGSPMPVLRLLAPATVDGSAPAEAHTGALTGGDQGTGVVRIFATSACRFLVGVAAEAAATDHPLAEGGEIWYPFKTGERVSIYGGIAVVAIAGETV